MPGVHEKIEKELEPSDVDKIKALLRAWEMMQGWCRVTRWIVVAAFMFFVLASQFVDSIKNLWGVVLGGRH